jgi:signal transduction histidine kinase
MREAGPGVLDLVLGCVLTAGALADVASLGRRAPAVLAIFLSVACTSSVAWRRRAPSAAVFVAVTSMLAYQLATADPRMTFEPYALAFCFYLLGRRPPARDGRVIQGALLGYALVTLGLGIRHLGTSTWAGDAAGSWLLFAVLPWALGILVGRHASMTRELATNVARLKDEQEIRALRAACDERNRVARELHDVIGHCVSVMVIQASAARLVAADDVAAARAALRTVGASGREAMADLRRVIGVLRRGGDGDIAGVAQLSTLIERTRDAGVHAQLSVRGPPHLLPATLDLVVYRVVQEALTNVVKHAAPARADVQVCFQSEMIELTITDTGKVCTPEGADRPVAGYGLVGMRERLALYGGQLTAGPIPGGGFAVHARIPLAGAPARTVIQSDQPSAAGEAVRSWHWPRPWLDPLVAGLWLVALEAEAVTSSHRHGPLLLNMLAVGGMALAGLWRRSAPLMFAFVTGMLSTALWQGLTSRGYATLTGIYGVLVPAYSLGAWEKRARAVAGIAVWMCAATAGGIAQHAQLSGLAGPLLAAAAAWSGGRVIRAQRELGARLRETSVRLAAEREDRARLAVASERTRIARDLHALVAQGVIVMIVQAEAAQNLLETDLGEAITSMSSIEDAGRKALAEMRRMLGILRNRQESPQPGLDQIRALPRGIQAATA